MQPQARAARGAALEMRGRVRLGASLIGVAAAAGAAALGAAASQHRGKRSMGEQLQPFVACVGGLPWLVLPLLVYRGLVFAESWDAPGSTCAAAVCLHRGGSAQGFSASLLLPGFAVTLDCL